MERIIAGEIHQRGIVVPFERVVVLLERRKKLFVVFNRYLDYKRLT